MLREIKKMLGEHGRLTLRELATHFKMSSDALEPMLQLLIDKGQVRSEALGCEKSCSGCSAACREDMLFYELVPRDVTNG